MEQELDNQKKKDKVSRKSKSIAGAIIIQDHDSDWDVSSDEEDS